MKRTRLFRRLFLSLCALVACSFGISRVTAADQVTTFLSFTTGLRAPPSLPPFNTNLVSEFAREERLESPLEQPRNWVENIIMNGSFSSIRIGYGSRCTGEDVFRFPRFAEHVGRRTSWWMEGGILCRYPLNDGVGSYDGGWAGLITWCRSF